LQVILVYKSDSITMAAFPDDLTRLTEPIWR
jgi:hypothetical protein